MNPWQGFPPPSADEPMPREVARFLVGIIQSATTETATDILLTALRATWALGREEAEVGAIHRTNPKAPTS